MSVLDSIKTNTNYVINWTDDADAYFIKSFVVIAQEDYLKTLDLLGKAFKTVLNKSVIENIRKFYAKGDFFKLKNIIDMQLIKFVLIINEFNISIK